jgi:hypothetical protein
MTLYHESGYLSRTNVSARIRDSLMRMSESSPEYDLQRENIFAQDTSAEGGSDNFAVYVIDGIVRTVSGLVGISGRHALNFFDPSVPLETQIRDDLFTFPRIIYDLSHCDIHRVMLCDAAPKNLFSVVVVSVFSMWLAGSLLPLPSGSFTFFMLVTLPWVVMWYSYGYSPACFPMVPTCFAGDLFALVNSTLPAKIVWPALLIQQDVCNLEAEPYNKSLTSKNYNCFKSCAAEEFRFRGWQDALAWILCDIDIDVCQSVSRWLLQQSRISLVTAYADTTEYFVQVLRFDNRHLTDAHRFCGFITGFYIIPAVFVALWLLLMAASFLKAVVVLAVHTALFVLTSTASTEPPPNNDGASTGANVASDAPDSEVITAQDPPTDSARKRDPSERAVDAVV